MAGFAALLVGRQVALFPDLGQRFFRAFVQFEFQAEYFFFQLDQGIGSAVFGVYLTLDVYAQQAEQQMDDGVVEVLVFFLP